MTLSGEVISAAQEVILCLVAFGTPQVLMLSGIGPSHHLSQHGIPVVADLPSVGANLADHPDVPIHYASDRLDPAARLRGHWLLNGGGPGGGAFFSTLLFHAFDDPALPELEVFMTPMIVEENLDNGAAENVPLCSG